MENIIKIVSGVDEESLEEISKVYELIIKAGLYKASCIKVAEAAKVAENNQRDINIAFMNELAMVFNRMGIDIKEVIDAMKNYKVTFGTGYANMMILYIIQDIRIWYS